MIALIQRCTRAQVVVDQTVVGQIDEGILALIGIQPDDTLARGKKLIDKILAYRIFTDEQGKMNRSVRDEQGGLLLVSQFTLAADTKSGNRPSFSTAAPPSMAEPMFDELLAYARQAHPKVETGRFGAHMEISLTNDGPVTFQLTT